MSNIETLYSKTFTGREDSFSFQAKSETLNLLVEERQNISQINIHLKGKKQKLHILGVHSNSENIFKIPTFEGETYLIEMSSAGELGRDEKDAQFERTSMATISAIWETKNV